MSNKTLIRQINAGARLELPFKPFTLNEVASVTGASARMMERWVGTILVFQHGSGVDGLSYMQCLGLLCGRRYLEEGASEDRAVAVMRMVASMNHDHLLRELKAGRTFPVPIDLDPASLQRGVMVKAPATVLGKRLNLWQLYEEFLARLEKVFPKG